MPVSNLEPAAVSPPTRATRRTLLQTASAGVVASAASMAFSTPALHAQGLTPISCGARTPHEAIMAGATPTAGTPVTVVLVHGAFADASGWAGVIERLQAAGIAVMAPANPLRGVSSDAASIASVVQQIPGPVLLVGHSYGGW